MSTTHQLYPRGTRVTVGGYPRPDQRRQYRYRYLFSTGAADGRKFHTVAIHDYEEHTHRTMFTLSEVTPIWTATDEEFEALSDHYIDQDCPLSRIHLIDVHRNGVAPDAWLLEDLLDERTTR